MFSGFKKIAHACTCKLEREKRTFNICGESVPMMQTVDSFMRTPLPDASYSKIVVIVCGRFSDT